MTTVLFVRKTGDEKTGKIPATYSSPETCPDACPLKYLMRRNNAGRLEYVTRKDKAGRTRKVAGPCYAKRSPRVFGAWQKSIPGIGKNASDWRSAMRKIAALPPGTLWRHNIAGDLPGTGNKISAKAMAQLIAANKGRRGFTYTHKPLDAANAAIIRKANREGFTVNISADTPAEADAALARNIGPVVLTIPAGSPEKQTTPAGNIIQACPQQTGKMPDCKTCKACASATRRAIIGFYTHGNGAAAIDDMLTGGN